MSSDLPCACFLQYVTPGEGANGEGVHDLELDESHLDLLDGSEVHIQDDGDMEVEDAGTLWLANSSQLVASNASNIQTQLAHILVEGGSSISIKAQSSWNVTQEFDFTPVQGTLGMSSCIMAAMTPLLSLVLLIV